MILRFLYYEVLLFLILRLVFEIMFKFLFLVFDFGLGLCMYVQCYLFTHVTFNLRFVFVCSFYVLIYFIIHLTFCRPKSNKKPSLLQKLYG